MPGSAIVRCGESNMRCWSTYINPGQPLVSKRGNEVAEHGNGEEDEKLLPASACNHGNGVAVRVKTLVKDIDTANEE